VSLFAFLARLSTLGRMQIRTRVRENNKKGN
jgi:hypothetical protein